MTEANEKVKSAEETTSKSSAGSGFSDLLGYAAGNITSDQFSPQTIPPLEEDGCSVEVLIESHAGFYVGYYFAGDWYEDYTGDKVGKQFKPKRWWNLPRRLVK